MIESRFGKVLLVITLKWAILEDLMNQFICYLYSTIASSSQTARGGTFQNLAICRLFVVPTNISIEFGKDCNCIKLFFKYGFSRQYSQAILLERYNGKTIINTEIYAEKHYYKTHF
jgi:hypothetical protein